MNQQKSRQEENRPQPGLENTTETCSVLFVCTANMVRSPSAEALFTRMVQEDAGGKKWRIESAGTWARNGMKVPAEVDLLMKLRGISMQRHRSRIVTAGILHQFSLILAMEPGHKEALQIEFPDVARRVYLLGEMSIGNIAVADPTGGIIDEYQHTVEEIEDLLIRGKKRIEELAVDRRGQVDIKNTPHR